MKKRQNCLSNEHYKELDILMTKYFFNNNHSNFLEILDSSKKGRDYYTGVTLEYIEKYVLHMQFSRLQIVNYIIKHHLNNDLKALYCSDVQNIVIHRIHHQRTYNKNNDYNYGETQQYEYFINHLNTFKNGE